MPLLFNMLSAAVKLLQSCLTLCDPIDDSPPGSPIPGILQARTLEWVCHYLLDSILKSRGITLPTKVRLVKAMVFLVVMYGFESCTIKKAENEQLMLLNCGVGEDS